MYEGRKVVKQIQSFLQTGLLLYLNSFQPSPLYHRNDLVSMFKGSLTVLSWALHVFFFSPPLRLSSGQQPCFYNFHSLHRGEAFQYSQKTEMLSFFLCCRAQTCLPRAWKVQNGKECKVRPRHDIHTVFWPAQGGLLINTLPTPPSETGDVALLRSKLNNSLKIWAYSYMQNMKAFFFFNRIERSSLRVWWAHVCLTDYERTAGGRSQREVKVKLRQCDEGDVKILQISHRSCSRCSAETHIRSFFTSALHTRQVSLTCVHSC